MERYKKLLKHNDMTIFKRLFRRKEKPERLTFTDSRDGKVYEITQVGDQIWMAENLAYKPDQGNYWAVDNKERKVKKHKYGYGYLYDWETATKVCPQGWCLPSKEDFEILFETLGVPIPNDYLGLIELELFIGAYGYKSTELGAVAQFWSSTIDKRYESGRPWSEAIGEAWSMYRSKTYVRAGISLSYMTEGQFVRCIKNI